jgi:hypothetical protein
MASPNKQQKRAHRAKAKAKQNRTQRAVATKPDAFAGYGSWWTTSTCRRTGLRLRARHSNGWRRSRRDFLR